MSSPEDGGTLRGSLGGYAFVVAVLETEDALFEYTVEIEGQQLWGGDAVADTVEGRCDATWDGGRGGVRSRLAEKNVNESLASH